MTEWQIEFTSSGDPLLHAAYAGLIDLSSQTSSIGRFN